MVREGDSVQVAAASVQGKMLGANRKFLRDATLGVIVRD